MASFLARWGGRLRSFGTHIRLMKRFGEAVLWLQSPFAVPVTAETSWNLSLWKVDACAALSATELQIGLARAAFVTVAAVGFRAAQLPWPGSSFNALSLASCQDDLPNFGLLHPSFEVFAARVARR
jgi:hypothetical protein